MNLPTELFTWEGLGSMAGAATAVFLLVQLTKQFLPAWFPVRIYAWFWGWGILTLAAFVLGSFTWPVAALNVLNGAIVALTAMGEYAVANDVGLARPKVD